MADKVEKLARIIARAVTGLDADTRVYPSEPYRVVGIHGYALPAEEFTRSLWFSFSRVAQAVLDAGFDCADESAAEQVPNDKPATDTPDSLPVTEAVAWSEIDRDAKQAANDAWRERMGLA